MIAILIIVVVVLAIVVAVPLVQAVLPVFGGRTTQEERKRYSKLPHFNGKRFQYPVESKMMASFKDMMPVLWKFLKGSPKRKPRTAIPLVPLGKDALRQGDGPRVIWFGHSAVLLQLDGLNILFDPMFGAAPSPFPAFGGKRFGGKLPLELNDLPKIDYVFISHDHYDHLDYPSIRRLASKVGHFYVPLGVGAHLKRWGIEPARITEHDWWDEFEAGGLRIACAPARHFSGRGTTNRDGTLWCSWVLRGREASVFFCGDSGYGPHFREIGERYGPFDLTMMECGQYDETWSDIHMLPEQTVQAHEDVRGKLLLPIHWGGFTLAPHDWDDPANRVTKEAARRGVRVTTPMIGESVPLAREAYPNRRWWEPAGQ